MAKKVIRLLSQFPWKQGMPVLCWNVMDFQRLGTHLSARGVLVSVTSSCPVCDEAVEFHFFLRGETKEDLHLFYDPEALLPKKVCPNCGTILALTSSIMADALKFAASHLWSREYKLAMEAMVEEELSRMYQPGTVFVPSLGRRVDKANWEQIPLPIRSFFIAGPSF